MTANGSITAQPTGPAVVPAFVSVDVSNSWAAAPSDSVTSLSAPSNSTISRNNSAVGLSAPGTQQPGVTRSHTSKVTAPACPRRGRCCGRRKDVHWSRAMQQLTGNSSKVVRWQLVMSARCSSSCRTGWLLLTCITLLGVSCSCSDSADCHRSWRSSCRRRGRR